MTRATETAAAVGSQEKTGQSTRPCLVFKEDAEQAINFYVSLIKNSRIVSLTRSDGSGPIPEGKVLHATFEIDGQEYTSFDGGPQFAFSDAFSLMVTCEGQAEVDALWDRLTDGGAEGPCGWLTDRFGLSWQVVPAALGEMIANPQDGNTAAMMEAMLKMKKLDIATLTASYQGGS